MRKLKPTYFESMKQCAAFTQIPLETLKDWKSQGCPAFRYSRVYHADLVEWKNKQTGSQEAELLPRSHWLRERERVDYERVKFNLEIQQKKYLERDEILSTVGQMLAAFTASCRDFPSRTARWLVGLKDQHQIQSKLQAEMDAMLSMFNQGRFLDTDIIPAVVEKLFADRTPQFRADLSKSCWQVFIEIGRQCFEQLRIKMDPQ